MLIPYGTDSPIYYWPFATVGLIVVNVLVYFFQVTLYTSDFFAGPGWLDLALSHGDGLHPVQWVTSFFIHGGILHLIGNMIFLWAFGLIVEGKIGPFKFVALYMGIGVFQNIIEQVLFLPFPYGPSLGASSAIYGIMMVALLWAPQEQIKCIFNPLFFYVYFVEIPIAFFGLVYFLMDFSLAMLDGFALGTAMLHLMGAVVGFIPGVAMLLMNRVDCEGRDLISMFLELFGKQPLAKQKTKSEIKVEQEAREVAKANRNNTIDRSWASMDVHLQAGNTKAAIEMFRQIRKLDSRQQWRESVLLTLIAQLQKKQNWKKVDEYSKTYLERFDARSNQIRLNLARLYVIHESKPRKALRTIQQFDLSTLDAKQTQIVKQIVKKSQEMIEDGVLEFGDE